MAWNRWHRFGFYDWADVVHFAVYCVMAIAVIVLVVKICDDMSCSHPAPVPPVARDTARFADTTATFYEMSDSMYVRVKMIPHGKGVVIEVQPVKVRKTKEAR